MIDLRQDKTIWVFFLATSKNEPEDRHVRDVGFGIHCLEKVRVPHQDIFLFIESINEENTKQILKEFSPFNYTINRISDFVKILTLHKIYKQCVMFVLGHGSYLGLDASPVISPSMLITQIKVNTHLQNVVVYLGQCYAGIFNYMNVRSLSKSETENTPEIIVIGATNLYTSIALSITENINGNRVVWVSNIFLHYIFIWFRNLVDIDGDSKFTIADSFKFAGLATNEVSKGFRIERFTSVLDESRSYSRSIESVQRKFNRFTTYLSNYRAYKTELVHKQIPRSKIRQRKKRLRLVRFSRWTISFYIKILARKNSQIASYKELRENLMSIYLFNHQEPWMLNANPAQEIEISLPS